MTKDQFIDVIHPFILKKLKEKNPFETTTGLLMRELDRQPVHLNGHNEFYANFIQYCEEEEVNYCVKKTNRSNNEKDMILDLIIAS